MDFLHQFTPTHFVGLAISAALIYIAKTVGKRFGRSVVELNDNLKHLNTTVHKADILWEKQADPAMWMELERRERGHAAKAQGA